ncbi:MAG TPA: Gfo/Idh/MocA family oxidoreductase [Acidimicrobiia bacterium]|nr:Gfo/Idh/MocA family oxidoreductase [Acidimicrobiia bacterium]
MDKKVKVGLVGAGAIAQTYAQVLTKSASAKLSAVADVRSEPASALAEAAGARPFPDHEALAKADVCEVVIVCTPPSSHSQITKTFLERGLPVMCEKPLSIDLSSAREMVELAKERKVILTMASKFRYVDDVIRAKSILSSGILGDIVLFENAFASRVDMTSRWNSNQSVSGGGVLIDNGTHSVDIARYLLGPITQVQAVEGRRVQAVGVEDTVRLFIRTASDVMGTIDLSWTINKELDTFVDIYGSHGVVRVGWKWSRFRQLGGTDWVTFGRGYDKLDAIGRQIDNFCAAVRGEERLLITADDALASVGVIEAAYRSLTDDRWVGVTSPKPIAAS